MCGNGCHSSPAVLGTDMQNMYGTCTCLPSYVQLCAFFAATVCVFVCMCACMYCVFGSKTFFFIQSVTVL